MFCFVYFVEHFGKLIHAFVCSRVESPEAGIVPSEYSKFPHQRTQSMDSMSSGHSSGDHAVFANQAPIHDQSKRGRQAKAVVMPMENPSDDDVPIYRRFAIDPFVIEAK